MKVRQSIKGLIDKIKLGRQATLFDSYLYVVKGFLSIFTGYVLFHNHSVLGNDMISLLFGMMLTLEPVNTVGIKSGFNQIRATVLGGIVTAVLVSLFGLNALTVPLGVALTMYISLKFNWRFVSPVAIFTAIYMTQYIQLDAMGAPSMWITLRLRILALGTGVAIAIFYNYLFSLVFYKGMIRKRIVYIIESLETHLNTYLLEEATGDLASLKADITRLFSDIDLVISHLLDIKKVNRRGSQNENYGKALWELRDFTHYFLDVIMYRMKHKCGVVDLQMLVQFRNLLIEIQKVIENKNSDRSSLKRRYEENLSLNIELDSYLSAMHQSSLAAAKCFLKG